MEFAMEKVSLLNPTIVNVLLAIRIVSPSITFAIIPSNSGIIASPFPGCEEPVAILHGPARLLPCFKPTTNENQCLLPASTIELR
jgi:hypothetical protein